MEPRPWQDPHQYVAGLDPSGSPIWASIDEEEPWVDGEPITQGELQDLYRILGELWEETQK